MNQPLYFKAQLIKYQPKADTLIPDDIKTQLDDITITTEKLFGDQAKIETEKVVHSQQYVTITHSEDPIRERVNRGLFIEKFNLYNDWTLVAEHYYDLLNL